MVERELFLKKKSLKEALQIWGNVLDGLGFKGKISEEKISTQESAFRIVSREVRSRFSSPFYTASAVDGIAVNAEDTYGATLANPKVLMLDKDGVMLNTGDPLPFGCNAVIMVENIEIKDNTFKIFSSINPYKNVRLIGEDIGIEETLLFPGELIHPSHIGVMLAGGVTEVWVKRKPIVAIIPTGEEIKKPGDKLTEGDIVDTNSYMLKAMVEKWGGKGIITDIKPNDINIISEEVKKVLSKVDIALVIGGSAKGNKDLTGRVFSRLGKVLVHGVSIQPGKPVILGVVDEKPVMGMPGFPVSAYIASRIFLKKAIFKMQGINEDKPKTIEAIVKSPVTSSIGVDEFVRVKIGEVQGETIAVPLKKGAGVLSSVARADGLLCVPFDDEGIESGSKVSVELIKSEDKIKNQLIFIGSNDPLLNALITFIKKSHPDFKVGIINSGSLGGLLALERGECNFTAAHLFDAGTATYNMSFLEKYVTKEVVVVPFSLREQGFVVQKSNPKNIKDIKDLIRKDISFVNRQKGSGTRVLFDYLLKRNGINPKDIKGYSHAEYTHLAVANNVKLGGADCGMAIHYVADVLGLDFIPVKTEQYDLVFLKSDINRKEVSLLLDAIKSDGFKEIADKFNGYKLNVTI